MSTQLQSDKIQRDELVQMDGDPVVVNLGCGTDETGIGIDINYQPDIKHDLNEGIPLADDSVDRIICEHVLEHLDAPVQLLHECQRVLRTDGALELELPNAAWLPVRLWITQDPHRFWTHKNPDRRGHWLARRLGNEDEERTAHRSLWTPALLSSHLDRAGFDYDISGSHLSRNFSATATPETVSTGQTLHELERDAGKDLASGDYWAQTRARILGDWVAEHQPERVLDVGCGSGYLTARIAAETAADVTGIDSNPDSIAAAQRRETTAGFRVGDAFDLREPSSSVDCVVFGDVLEHLQTPADALAEARRVLADDGTIIISVPAYRWLWGPHDEHNDHEDRYTAARLGDLVARADCELNRHRYTNLVPLVPYALYQRVFEREIPTGVRGEHGGITDWLKRRAIDMEVAVPWPAGITLIGEAEPA